MKKFTLLLSLFLAVGLTSIHAQTEKAGCAKSCAKTCTKTVKADGEASAEATAAAKLASMDETIDEKVCSTTGKVSYVRTVKDANGEASVQNVRYDAAKGEFVNMAPGEKGCCAGASACCSSKKAKADTKKSST